MNEHRGIYVILTRPDAGYERCTEAAVELNLGWIQLRTKLTPRPAVDPELLALARRLRDITRGSRTRLIINDDVWLAAEADADGLHLGQADMAVAEARRLWGKRDAVFGLSTHSELQLEESVSKGPDYIGVGPVYPTPSKLVPDPVLGAEQALRLLDRAWCPAVGIGGLTVETIPDLVARGARWLAVLRPVCQASDPRQAMQQLLEAYEQGLELAAKRCEVAS